VKRIHWLDVESDELVSRYNLFIGAIITGLTMNTRSLSRWKMSKLAMTPLVAVLLLAAACVPLPAAPAALTISPTPSTAPPQLAPTATPPSPGERPLAEMPSAPPAGVAGGDSIGDPYAPELGNAGYDVQHYRLALAVDAAAAQITGTVTVSATSTIDRLGRISLDLAGYQVDRVRASGSPLRFYRSLQKLYVELPQPVNRGGPFAVEVDYHGAIEARPSHWRRPEVRLGLNITRTLEGPQVVARNQPDGARNWLPCNDHPLDKATYRIEISVPRPLVAVSNGSPVAARAADGWTTWVWDMDAPMATYVLGLAIGPYQRVDAAPAGVTVLAHYVFPADIETASVALAPTAEMMRFLEDCLGPYPFATYGYVEVTPHLGLETQTMVTLGREILGYEDLPEYMIHEHLHHWFGDSVTPASWSEIWLNEGFATYFEYLWRSRDATLPGCEGWNSDAAWLEGARKAVVEAGETAPLGWPEPEKLLGTNSYYKGAWVLHMLRAEIGNEAFFIMLRRYYARHAGVNVRTADFRAAAEEVSGRDLSSFFSQWVMGSGQPVLDTTWTSRPSRNGAVVTVQLCQRQAETFTFPLALAFPAPDGRSAEARMVVDQTEEAITVTLPFAPARLDLDPDLQLLAEMRPPEQVEVLQPCAP
jgi:aminopeptidase N